MFNLTVETEARKGCGQRGRPRVWYVFDEKRRTGLEWSKALGITPQQFYRRLRRYRLQPSKYPAWTVFQELFLRKLFDSET